MKVLLYSGGTDSWLINKIWKPDICLYVDMKSMYSKAEWDKVMNNKPKNLLVSELPLGQFEDPYTAFIPMRNLYLLMHACNYGDEICLGATKEDAGGSSDKDLDFINEAEHILNRLWAKQSLYEGKEIKIEKRFLFMTKDDLLDVYLKEGGDINTFKRETFSCYSPIGNEECLSCKACFRKWVVCYLHGASYMHEELVRVYKFAEKNVVHRSHHASGRYFMDKDNAEDTLKALQRLYTVLGKELNLD